MVLLGLTFWCMYLVHIISKDAMCGPGARQGGEMAEGYNTLCLMLKLVATLF